MSYKGIVTDLNPQEQPEGTYRWAKNKVLNRKFVSIADDMPVSALNYGLETDSDSVDIGKISLPGEDTAIFSVAFEELNGVVSQKNRIRILHTNGQSTMIMQEDLLNFKEHSFVDGVCVVNYDKTRSIIWTDNINPPRMLNIDSPEIALGDDYAVINKEEFSRLDYFITAKAPNIKSVDVADAGGSLPCGMLFYSVAYQIDEDGYTNYMPISNAVPITSSKKHGGYEFYMGEEPGTKSGKSVTIEFERLDTKFNRYKIACIEVVNSQTKVYEIGKGLIDEFGGSKFTHTGTEVSTPMLLEDLLINNADYKTAKTLTFGDNKLYMGHLTTEDYSGQDAANDIELEWVFDEDISMDGVNGSFKDGSTCFLKKSWMPGEVGAFYIAWVTNTGGYTPAYLISGRKATTIDVGNVTVNEDDTVKDVKAALEADTLTSGEYLDDDITLDENVKYFHTRETARISQTKSEGVAPDDEVVGATGVMGFWENDELYPEEFPDFAGEKVRHHRFPTLNTLASAGLYHTLVEGQSPTEKVENYDISLHPNANILKFQDDSPVTNELADVTISHDNDYETGYCYNHITFKKKCVVSLQFKTKFEGYSYVVGATFGTKVYATAGLSFTADGHGDLVEPVDNSNHKSWIIGYGEIVCGAEAAHTGTYVMEKGSTLKMMHYISNLEHGVDEFKYHLRVKEWTVDENGIDGTIFTNSLGISLKNIRVPETLQGKVTGYQIFYAKKSILNSTVYAMGQPLSYQDADPTPNANSVFRMHPGDLMANDAFPSISLSYVRHEVNLETNLLEAGQGYGKVDELNVLNRVNDYQYLPHYQNKEALFKYTLLSATSSDWTHGKLATLCGYKTNLYSVYYDQELVCTGPVFQKTRSSVEKLFGGDTYINPFSFRVTDTDVDETYQHMLWSANHLGYRQEGTEYGEMFYPVHLIPGEFGDFPEGFLSQAEAEKSVNNFVKVSPDYTQLNVYNQAHSENITRNYITEFRHRVIGSTVLHIEGSAYMLRRVLPASYHEMPKDKGIITNLQAINGEILIHTEHSLYKTVSKTQLETDEIAVTLGSGNIFGMPPEELYYDQQGVAGTLHQEACEVLNGHYIFVDERVGHIYSVREQLKSFASTGNTHWFREHMGFEIVKQLENMGFDSFSPTSPYSRMGVGYSVGFDTKYNRYFVTKKDFKLNEDITVVQEPAVTLKWGEDTADFLYVGDAWQITPNVSVNIGSTGVRAHCPDGVVYNIERIIQIDGVTHLITERAQWNDRMPASGTYWIYTQTDGDPDKVYLQDGQLFDYKGRVLSKDSVEAEDKSFTASFSLDGMLVSSHSHTPGLYLSTTKNLRSLNYGELFTHNSYINPIPMESFVDMVHPYQKLSRTSSVIVHSQAFNQESKIQPKVEFDAIRVFNDTQCSLEIDVTQRKGRTGHLVFNNFMDHVGEDIDFIEDNVIDDTKLTSSKLKRFFSTFIITRLINRNIVNNFVLLYNAKAKENPL